MLTANWCRQYVLKLTTNAKHGLMDIKVFQECILRTNTLRCNYHSETFHAFSRYLHNKIPFDGVQCLSISPSYYGKYKTRESVNSNYIDPPFLSHRYYSTNTNTDPEKKVSVSATPADDITSKSTDSKMETIINVPNVITMARILATPYLAYLIIQGAYPEAVGVLAIASISDWVDGYIARKYKQESTFGSFLDPLADKLLIGTLSLSMLYSSLIPWPLVVLIFGRDVLLVSGTFYHRYRTKEKNAKFFDYSSTEVFQVEPSMLSKINTALQFSLFGLTLVHAAWQIPPHMPFDILYGVVGVTTVLSGSTYLKAYMKMKGSAFVAKRK